MLMNAMGNALPGCKLQAATAAAIAACDGIDGVEDGVLEDPQQCDYDPAALVGTSAGDCGAFTDADVEEVLRKLWEGPRRQDGRFLWYGLPRGADLNALWGSQGTPPQPRAFIISMDWFRYFLAENPQLDWTTISRDRYERFWDQSVEQYSAVIATDNPDLTAFRDRGGKVLIWHGWADQLISTLGTIDYYQRVKETMGGAEATFDFARLFLAPGIQHCAGGPGPMPYGQLDALRSWVEDGEAPETLPAARRDQSGTITRSRPTSSHTSRPGR